MRESTMTPYGGVLADDLGSKHMSLLFANFIGYWCGYSQREDNIFSLHEWWTAILTGEWMTWVSDDVNRSPIIWECRCWQPMFLELPNMLSGLSPPIDMLGIFMLDNLVPKMKSKSSRDDLISSFIVSEIITSKLKPEQRRFICEKITNQP